MHRLALKGVAFVVLVSLVLPAKLAEQPQFQFRELFTRTVKGKGLFWETDWDGDAFFDPTGSLIFLAEGMELKVIDWRSKAVIASASYSHLFCARGPESFWGWSFVPNHEQVLVIHCNSVYVIDSQSLEIKKEVHFQEPEAPTALVVSPDGAKIAVATFPYGQRTPGDVYLFDAEYELIAKWAVDTRDLAFSPNGGLLAVRRSVDLLDRPDRLYKGFYPPKRGIEVRRVLSGEIFSEWWYSDEDGYIGDLRFVTTQPNMLAANVNYFPFVLAYWDVDTGELVKKVAHDHDHGGHFRRLFFSPDWEWAISTYMDDPGDTDYIRDYIICNPMTGEVIYQTPAQRWNIFGGLFWFWLPQTFDHEILDLSNDGKYLLVRRYNQLQVKEIVRRQPTASGKNQGQ